MMLLRGGNILDLKNMVVARADVLVSDGLITEIINDGSIPDKAEIVDVSGKYVSPGLIDSHIHIESSMLSPVQFARESIIHGTTCVLADPHEIVNVFGRKAMDAFIDISRRLPIDIYLGVPSCVPATDLETSASVITIEDIIHYMKNDRVYGLAEMMDFQDIIHGAGTARKKVDAVYDFGKIVDGHCPGLRGDDLSSYISNDRCDGIVRIMNDHETSDPDEAMEKLEKGLFLAIRYGSAEKDLDKILPSIVKRSGKLSRCMLCSDDLSPRELEKSGHMDRTVKRARDIISETTGCGLEESTLTAVSMATINPAIYLDRFLKFHSLPPVGLILPGYRANIAVFNSLKDLTTELLVHNGEMAVKNGALALEMPEHDFSEFYYSVRLPGRISPDAFRIKTAADSSSVRVRVMEILPETILTKISLEDMAPDGGVINASPEKDLAKIAVFERHRMTGGHFVGLVKGLGLKRGAIASTIAHDSHNLIVVGMDDRSMARAADYLIDHGGGIAAVDSDMVMYLPLKIGGLMSTYKAEKVANTYDLLKEMTKKMGARMENIFMTVSFLALPVIPEIRITDRGLVDVLNGSFIGIFST
ncbi:MAG: adenine deaminase [Spirochaetes bacterium]|jgi:adenine deaminase|nr:adenine deaminase [Spirochaetota bacterium]